MTALSRFVVTVFASFGLTMIAVAGPERIAQSYKESKEVAPVPPAPCDWSGFYIGLHAGGQFGHSEDKDLDGYGFNNHSRQQRPVLSVTDADIDAPDWVTLLDYDRPWGYGESGFVGGGQVGYNLQLGRFVLGPEFDVGYMNLDGSGHEPRSNDTRSRSDSDFYTTLRGRLGVALDWNGCWLLYATGGGIAVNYHTRLVDDCNSGDCGPGLIDISKEELNWGYTFGGGVERQIGRHWSIKLEYLYFNLDEQSFHGLSDFGGSEPTVPTGNNEDFRFLGETHGHIIRGGLNFRF